MSLVCSRLHCLAFIPKSLMTRHDSNCLSQTTLVSIKIHDKILEIGARQEFFIFHCNIYSFMFHRNKRDKTSWKQVKIQNLFFCFRSHPVDPCRIKIENNTINRPAHDVPCPTENVDINRFLLKPCMTQRHCPSVQTGISNPHDIYRLALSPSPASNKSKTAPASACHETLTPNSSFP